MTEDILAAVIEAATRTPAQLTAAAVKSYARDRKSLTHTARLLGETEEKIREVLTEAGVRIRGRQPGIRREPTLFLDDEEGLARACAAEYAAGTPLAVLAEKYVRPVRLLRALVERQGIDLRRKGTPSPETPEQERALVVKLYVDQVKSINSVADRTNLTKYRVKEILLEAGVALRDPGSREKLRIREPTAEEAAELVRRYKAGESSSKLAETTIWPWARIRRLLLDHGVELRGPGPVPPELPDAEQRQEFVRRYRAGEPLRKMAEGTPWRREQLAVALRLEGVDVKPGKRYVAPSYPPES